MSPTRPRPVADNDVLFILAPFQQLPHNPETQHGDAENGEGVSQIWKPLEFGFHDVLESEQTDENRRSRDVTMNVGPGRGANAVVARPSPMGDVFGTGGLFQRPCGLRLRRAATSALAAAAAFAIVVDFIPQSGDIHEQPLLVPFLEPLLLSRGQSIKSCEALEIHSQRVERPALIGQSWEVSFLYEQNSRIHFVSRYCLLINHRCA